MPILHRRARPAAAALLSALAAALFLVIAAPTASAAVVSGDWGYQTSVFTGSDQQTSQEYAPKINSDTIYQGVLVCVSGPCDYQPGMTVTTDFSNAVIVDPVGTTIDYSRPGYITVGSCLVTSATQLVCTVSTTGTLLEGNNLFVGTAAADIEVTGSGVTGTAFSTTTWVPGAGNTAPGNVSTNDVQTVTFDLSYFGEDFGLPASGSAIAGSSGPATYTVSCVAAPSLGACWYPDSAQLGYINYLNGASVTSPIGSLYDVVGAGSEVVGQCEVTSAVRVDCSIDNGRSLPIGGTLTSMGWTESFPAGPDGALVRTDAIVPYDGSCRDPEGCRDGDDVQPNSETAHRLGDDPANNTRSVTLVIVTTLGPTTPAPAPTTAAPTTTAPALAATGARSQGLLGLGLWCLGLGAAALAATSLTRRGARR